MTLPCPLDRLVPHRKPMRWLDSLVAYEPDWGAAEARIEADHPLAVPSGGLHPFVAIELIAQAAAAHEGYRRALEGRPVGGGFLTGVRDFSVAAAPEVGRLVTAVAQRSFALGSMEVVRGRVESGGRCLAEGELVFFLSDDLVPEAFRRAGETTGDAAVASPDSGILPALRSCLLEVDPELRRATFVFPPEFPAFAGHFPGIPVLPAVVTVVAAAEIAARLDPGAGRLSHVKRAKFTRPIPPAVRVEVTCAPATGEGARRWRLELSCEGERAAVVTVGEAPPAGLRNGRDPAVDSRGDGAC